MADSYNVGIANSWGLKAFAKSHGKMKVAEFTNSKDNKTFKSCAFVAPDGTVTLVGFSSNLGELTPSEIKNRVDDLQVVELESGSYKLCERGFDTWEEVDLGI